MKCEYAEIAHEILFVSPVTGEQLYPTLWPENTAGEFVIIVQDKLNKETWKHTITTEEL